VASPQTATAIATPDIVAHHPAISLKLCFLRPRVRRSIATFTPAQITTLRNGVAAMKAKPVTDPTSWLYQANIHGTTDTPAQTAWSTCRHDSLLFLAWHRMYLYYFERILRKASGDPSFNLPYWNYSDAAQRFLPLPFRSPANATNPLFVSQRAPGINNGTTQLSSSAVSFANAFSFINFDTSSLSFSARLSGTPHGVVHTSIGGSTGFMSFFSTAGRDPIFWLHHANIDRLWNRWLAQGGGRTNPTTNTTWMNTKFTFFNENGSPVQMSGSQVVSTARNLCYRYDDDPPLFPVIVARRPLSLEGDPPPEEVARSEAAVELSAAPVRVSLPVPANALQRGLTAEPEGLVLLELDEISFDRFPGIYYEVYVGLPEGEEPDPESIHYAGNLQFFGVSEEGHHGTITDDLHTFDITANVRALRDAELWKEGDVPVTLVPRGLSDEGAATLAAEPAATVKVGRISLSMDPLPPQ
jgi:tyrosinase